MLNIPRSKIVSFLKRSKPQPPDSAWKNVGETSLNLVKTGAGVAIILMVSDVVRWSCHKLVKACTPKAKVVVVD